MLEPAEIRIMLEIDFPVNNQYPVEGNSFPLIKANFVHFFVAVQKLLPGFDNILQVVQNNLHWLLIWVKFERALLLKEYSYWPQIGLILKRCLMFRLFFNVSIFSSIHLKVVPLKLIQKIEHVQTADFSAHPDRK